MGQGRWRRGVVLSVFLNFFIEKIFKNSMYYDSKIILNIFMRLWDGDQWPN